MSVIVMGMQMPSECLTADESIDRNCPMDRVWCAMKFAPHDMNYRQRKKEQIGKLPDWCPLRPLPEKHGRLIDADAMERFMSDTVQGDIRGYPYSDTKWEMAFRWLDNQPAIVEAEGE